MKSLNAILAGTLAVIYVSAFATLSTGTNSTMAPNTSAPMTSGTTMPSGVNNQEMVQNQIEDMPTNIPTEPGYPNQVGQMPSQAFPGNQTNPRSSVYNPNQINQPTSPGQIAQPSGTNY